MLRKYLKYLVLLIGIAAVAFFLYKFHPSVTLRSFRWSDVATSIRHANLSLLILSIFVIFTCYAVRALRWIHFSRTLGPSKFWSVYSATLMGFSCVFLLGRAGEPVRPVLIARKESLSMPGMFGIFLLERIFDAAAAVVIAGIALVLFEKQGTGTAQGGHLIALARSSGIVLFLLLIVVVAFLVYFRFHGGEWLSRRLQRPVWRTGVRARIASLVEGFSDGLQAVKTWGDLLILIAYSAVHWALVFVVYVLVMHGFASDLPSISAGGIMLVLAFTLFGSAIQLPVAGGGAQAATFFALTGAFGAAEGPAATVAVIMWLISFASCCLAGIPLLFREGLSMSELRRITREEEREGEAGLLAEAERAARIEDSPR